IMRLRQRTAQPLGKFPRAALRVFKVQQYVLVAAHGSRSLNGGGDHAADGLGGLCAVLRRTHDGDNQLTHDRHGLLWTDILRFKPARQCCGDIAQLLVVQMIAPHFIHSLGLKNTTLLSALLSATMRPQTARTSSSLKGTVRPSTSNTFFTSANSV